MRIEDLAHLPVLGGVPGLKDALCSAPSLKVISIGGFTLQSFLAHPDLLANPHLETIRCCSERMQVEEYMDRRGTPEKLRKLIVWECDGTSAP